MIHLHLPFLELSIVTALIGGLLVIFETVPERARSRSVVITGLVLLFTAVGWEDFSLLHTFQANDRWDLISRLLGDGFAVVDELSAPLLPLAALIYFLTALTTPRTKLKRFSFVSLHFSEAILLLTLTCKDPRGLVVLLTLGALPPVIEISARGRSGRVFMIFMSMFFVLMIGGWLVVEFSPVGSIASHVAAAMLAVALLMRAGIAPLHGWITDFFEKASFGTSLLFFTPMVGAYGMLRLVVPIAPDWVLHTVIILSLLTAVYTACMATIQHDARRLFCYLLLSHSSLVFVGLEMVTPIGMTGSLCIWLSVGMSLAGFGLTLRALEGRNGRLSLLRHQGLYDHTPTLAVFFLLTGLASIGFPGTIGFVGIELLVDGAVQYSAWAGFAIVIAAAMNGIAIVRAYFRIFAGTEVIVAFPMRSQRAERFAVLLLVILILGGGLYPQPGVASRYHAVKQLLNVRNEFDDVAPAGEHASPMNTLQILDAIDQSGIGFASDVAAEASQIDAPESNAAAREGEAGVHREESTQSEAGDQQTKDEKAEDE